jgi:hypothetical protein
MGFGSVRAKEKRALSVRVIESTRASRGEVVLSQIHLSYDLLAQAIDRLDTSFLTADQMKAILPFVPTLDEISKLQRSLRNAGSSNWFKCECEKFMEALLHVPDAEEKLHYMIFIKTFSNMASELKKGEYHAFSKKRIVVFPCTSTHTRVTFFFSFRRHFDSTCLPRGNVF